MVLVETDVKKSSKIPGEFENVNGQNPRKVEISYLHHTTEKTER
jgi:hypothetical protein